MIFVSIGHVLAERNRVNLARTLPGLLSNYQNPKLKILGHIYLDDFIHLADQLGVRDPVKANGEVPDELIASEFAIAKLEAHDVHANGISITSLESMAIGLSVVLTTNPDSFHSLVVFDREFAGVESDISESIAQTLFDLPFQQV